VGLQGLEGIGASELVQYFAVIAGAARELAQCFATSGAIPGITNDFIGDE
jgi:hypothetical protein